MIVRVAVDETLKGKSGDAVEVILPNALMPDDQWMNPRVGVVDAMPMIYAGDNVILLLVADPNTLGDFDVRPWTGTYIKVGERTRAVEGNPFSNAIEKLTLADLKEAIRAVVD